MLDLEESGEVSVSPSPSPSAVDHAADMSLLGCGPGCPLTRTTPPHRLRPAVALVERPLLTPFPSGTKELGEQKGLE